MLGGSEQPAEPGPGGCEPLSRSRTEVKCEGTGRRCRAREMGLGVAGEDKEGGSQKMDKTQGRASGQRHSK